MGVRLLMREMMASRWSHDAWQSFLVSGTCYPTDTSLESFVTGMWFHSCPNQILNLQLGIDKTNSNVVVASTCLSTMALVDGPKHGDTHIEILRLAKG